MFVEATKGIIVNLNHVREMMVSDDQLEITFILDNNEKITETYSDEYAVKNILESIRQECGIFLKEDDEHTM